MFLLKTTQQAKTAQAEGKVNLLVAFWAENQSVSSQKNQLLHRRASGNGVGSGGYGAKNSLC